MAETDLTSTIADAAAGPARIKTDSVEAQAQPLRELIAADEYLTRKAAGRKKHRGIGLIKIVPPGAV